MRCLVRPQIGLGSASLRAKATMIWLLACVCSHMTRNTLFLGECHGAEMAAERFLAGVYTHVFFQIKLPLERLAAVAALARPFADVGSCDVIVHNTLQ